MAVGDVRNGGAITPTFGVATTATTAGQLGGFNAAQVVARIANMWGLLIRGVNAQADLMFWEPAATANRRIFQQVLTGGVFILNGWNDAFGARTALMSFDLSNGNVGIGVTPPTASCALEIASTTGALLLPRMTTVQRNAMTAANGMLIYNTTTAKLEGYEAGAWRTL